MPALRYLPFSASPTTSYPDHPYTVSRSPVPSTPSSARTASVTGPSVSSSGSPGAFTNAEPVAAERKQRGEHRERDQQPGPVH